MADTNSVPFPGRNMPNDTYTHLIVQRGDAEAAAILADSCRAKDRAIDILRKQLRRFEVPCRICGAPCVPDGPEDTAPTCDNQCEEVYQRMMEAEERADHEHRRSVGEGK